MKFKLFLALFFLSILKSNAQKKIYDYLKKEASEYKTGKLVSKYRDTKQSNSSQLVKWVDTGQNIVFSYKRLYDIPDMFDEETETILNFEIPHAADSFQIISSHSDSLKQPLFYDEITLTWLRLGILKSAQGFIKGRREGEAWKIEGDLQMKILDIITLNESQLHLQFSKVFTKWKEKHGKNYSAF